ncbi:MAG: hypothetical protein DME23_00975 [Verrucomicrobia bacterium]|nr:MAG: hypothetical protein DME23_00975 [Verrucomicrobiota bacterium]
MNEDSELLRRYAEHRDEAAFERLVQRHVNLVFSAALRQTGGDAQTAEDVTQTVFADLARKAGSLGRRGGITGWLYSSTRFAAAKMRRADHRRKTREHEATDMNTTSGGETAPSHWRELAPVLDEAMHDLKAQDREAVLLRYFQSRDFKSVGAALGLSEGAAQMRVSRAVERLRRALMRRGIAVSAAALAATLGSDAVVSAPAGLAASAASSALATAAAGSGTTVTLIKLMTMTKLKAGIVSAVVAAGLTTSVVVQQRSLTRQREENNALREQTEQLDQQLAQVRADNQRLAKIQLDANELDQLRKEHLEIPRLRAQAAELARLRRSMMLAEAKPQEPNETEANLTEGEKLLKRLKDEGLPRLASEDFPAVVWIFKDPTLFPKIDVDAVNFLPRLDPNTKAALAGEVVSPLVDALKHEDQWTRWNAAILLGFFGTDAKRALPALADVLETRIEADAGLQGKAAAAIWQIGPDARTLPVLIDALGKALDDKEPFVRQPVCLALSKFGPEAKAAVPYLLKASEDEDPMVKKSALEALRNIDPNSLTPERLKSLQPKGP